ncbi:hypothetical protein KIN20_035234 [Parelaphostrongylus tenuis]|uniref:Uncharacterized protein n=1 Tax=Parelaphostrongylus tenuis TaxID=148309 RepID=A0AAD5WKM7_PARTN|nr:hypothetical protein KIN20_035234 [Parelaphostrongylus tenuis]
MEHLATDKVVSVVTIRCPRDRREYAQNIPLREIYINAPKELHEYFRAGKGKFQKTSDSQRLRI